MRRSTRTREKRNIWTLACPEGGSGDGGSLFPAGLSPLDWVSCEDAYEHTWLRRDDDLELLVDEERILKLARSSGYCPHRRCQLGDLRSPSSPGECPPGLCYTKLEGGAPTFGACCYDSEGKFDSGGLIGDFDRQRPRQKPIYKKNVVRLGAEGRFINANEVYPGIIITQCPLLGPPHDSAAIETLSDWKEMIIQERIDTVIQLHPYVNAATGEVPPCTRNSDICGSPCRDWAREIFGDENHRLAEQVRDFRVEEQGLGGVDVAPATLYSYSVGGQRVRHWWLRSWADFEVPSMENDELILHLAREMSSSADRGMKSLVVCYAGRGRSGTLASIAIGLKRRIKTSDALVDIIVDMRESRDSLVETPLQFAYVHRLLGLEADPSTAQLQTQSPAPRLLALPLVLLATVMCCPLAPVRGQRSKVASFLWYSLWLSVMITSVYLSRE